MAPESITLEVFRYQPDEPDGGGEGRGQGLPVAARYSLRLGASPGWPRRSKGQQAATYRSGRQGS